jgi:hypothetical protein
MKKYPTYFIIWTLVHLYLLIQSIGVDHGSENFFFPFCISKTGIEYWPSLASYDLLEFLIYVVIPFSLLSIRKKKSKDEEKLKPEQEQTTEQSNASEISSADANKEVKIKWFDKSKNVILASVFFFPLGIYCLIKSKKLTSKTRLISIFLCLVNLSLFIKGIQEDVENAEFKHAQSALQTRFDEFNQQKNLIITDDCLTTDCIDKKLLTTADLLNEINSIYYQAKKHDISVNKEEIITELRDNASYLRTKKFELINEERRTERLRRREESQQNAEKAHYDSLATLVLNAENILDEQEYKLDHLRRYDAVPDLGILFYIAFKDLTEREYEIEQYPDLLPRLKTIKMRKRELIQRTTYM